MSIGASYPRPDLRPREPKPPVFGPLYLLIGVLAICATVLLIETVRHDPGSSQAVAIAAPVEVTRVVTVTNTSTPAATQTARIVVLTPTGTATPVIPWCDQTMTAGTLCVALPLPRTATSIPECPAHPTYEFVCRKPDEGSGAAGETE